MPRIRRDGKETMPVKKIIATRAVYVSDDIQRIEVRLELENGERITFDMGPRQAHAFITQLTSAYEAIHPPITRYNPNSPQF